MKTDIPDIKDWPTDENILICTICKEINIVDLNSLTDDYYCQDCGTMLVSQMTSTRPELQMFINSRKKELKEQKRKERGLKYWALRKWRFIKQNYVFPERRLEFFKELENKIPELKPLMANCSYCHEYADEDNHCPECPLTVNGKCCSDDSHPYRKWFKEGTDKTAQAMINLIKNVKVSRASLFFRIIQNEDN